MKQIAQIVSLDSTEHNSSGKAQKEVQSRLCFSPLSPKVLSAFTFGYIWTEKAGIIILQEEKKHCCHRSLHHHPYLGFSALSRTGAYFPSYQAWEMRGRQNDAPSLCIRRNLGAERASELPRSFQQELARRGPQPKFYLWEARSPPLPTPSGRAARSLPPSCVHRWLLAALS